MSPIRNDVSRLELFTSAGAALDGAPAGQHRSEPFSDFAAFAGDQATVHLGGAAASLDPQHAARAVVGFIAEG